MAATFDVADGPNDGAPTVAPSRSEANHEVGLWAFLRSDRRAVFALVGALVVLLAISVWLAWNLAYASDESSHIEMVRFQAHNLRLADWHTFEYRELRGHPYHLYSPLAYLSYLPFEWLSSAIGPVSGATMPDYFIDRLGALPIAVAQFVVVLALVRRMLRRPTPLQIVAVSLAVNLIPQVRYLQATVNSDAMTILVATIAFALALRVLQRPRLTIVDAVLVGGVLGAGAHMRYNVVVGLAVLVVVFGLRVLRQRCGWRVRLRFLGLAVAIPMLVAVPFHLHVMAELRNGHVLASSDHEELRASTFDGVISVIPPVGKRVQIAEGSLDDMWIGMWAAYPKYFELRGNLPVAIGVLCGLGVAGLVLARGRVLERTGQTVALVAVGAVVVSWALMALTWPLGAQGRFLLPAAVAALAGVVLGTAALIDRVLRVRRGVLLAAGLWSVFLLYLNVMAAASVP